MEITEKFDRIRAWYEQRDREMLARGERPTHTTEYGIWGAASMLDAFEFFSKIRLERFESFADYGAGDGRIVLVAALFTKAVGIEGDEALCAVAEEARAELAKEIPELGETNGNAKTHQGDYCDEDHSQYDMIWVFMDHPYPRKLEQDLKKNFSGFLISYNEVHVPHTLKKGKTYWIQQLPILSFPINTDPDEDLFAPTEKNKEDPAIKELDTIKEPEN